MNEWIDEDAEERVDLGLWKKLLAYTLQYRKTAVAFTVVALFTAGVDLAFPIFTGRFIDHVRTSLESRDLTDDSIRNLVVPYALGYLGLTFALAAGIWCFIMCAGKIRTHVSHDIRRDAFAQLQKLSFSFYDQRPVGWLMARLTSDCQRLSNILAWGVIDFIWGTSLMLGASAVMLIYNWQLALVVLAVVPVLFLVSVFFRKRILRASRLVRKCNSKLTARYNEGITGVRTSKVFLRLGHNLRDFDDLAGQMQEHSVRNAILSAVYLPIVLSLASVAVALSLSVGGYQAITGDRTVGDIVMFMYFSMLFFGPIQDLSAWFAELQMAQASAERVLNLIEAEPDIRDREHVVAKMQSQGNDGHPDALNSIEFKQVGFRYETGPQVLHDIDLKVEPGQTIAIVGATGGGKSTLVNLLCRFYEPTSGQIHLDGVDYRDRSLQWLQSKLGIVLQQPHLFSGTIADNIRYGKQTADQDEAEAAAKLAGAHAFISQLPDAYETQVGEGGSQLSLGQKQLISFARAILKQPTLLIMDEATSSIDTETEQQIQAGVESLLADRTSFVIAHRLSTVRSADRILVVDEGRIVEQGSHRELLAKRARYYELYTQQAL